MVIKRFVQFKSKKQTVDGVGYYEKVNMDYYIETEDPRLIKYFKTELRKKNFINQPKFIMEDGSETMSGKFIIAQIDIQGTTAIIHLKKS